MTNRGIKEIYNQIIDEEIGKYYINLNLNKNGNVNIEDSYKIVTPWVQFGYSFYLNHINKKTKNAIKGSTFGVQFEWMAHNIAYYMGVLTGNNNFIKKGESASIGGTIFDDDHGKWSVIMQCLYMIYNPIFYNIDKSVSMVTWRWKIIQKEIL